MSHMQPEFEFGDWIEVDGNAGTTFIPPGHVSLPDYAVYEEREAAGHLPDDMDCAEAWLRDASKAVKDYVESSTIYSITVRKGWGARLQAPGYMDATDWSVYDTEAEAKRELCELYELCPVCFESVYDELERGHNPACRLHHVKH